MMIFDDHDVHDDWNTSQAWVEEMRAQPWWQRAHHERPVLLLGLPAPGQPLPGRAGRERVCCSGSSEADDGGPILREWAWAADHEANGSRWSYATAARPHQAGRVRLARGTRARPRSAQDDRRRRVGLDRAPGDRRLRPPDRWPTRCRCCCRPARTTSRHGTRRSAPAPGASACAGPASACGGPWTSSTGPRSTIPSTGWRR